MFDVVVSFEERVFEAVEEVMEARWVHVGHGDRDGAWQVVMEARWVHLG